MDRKTVYIVDDHKIVIDGISSFMIGHSGYELIGYALSASELFDDLKNKVPDILLLDIRLPGLSGLQIAKILNADYPQIKIVFLSSNTDKDSLNEAIASGAKGYFSKDITKEEFFEGLNSIVKGESYYSKGIHQTLFGSFTKQVRDNHLNTNNLLSQREIDVIRLIAEGLSMKEIGEKLFISPRTVESHKNNILSKLELTSTIDLVKYAIKNGLAEL